MLRLLIEYAVQNLVNHTDQVFVSEVIDGIRSIIEIRVAPDDIGKVIGKDGRTIKALRSLANAITANQGREATLDVLGA